MFGELVQARAVLEDGQLSIKNAQKKDSGLYKCKASNSLGHDLAVTQLNVVELPQFTIRPSAQLELSENRNITVPCQATGDPKPTVTWVKENSELPSGRSKVSVDGTLEIWNTKEEDSGRYTCKASSAEVLKASSAMMLTVRGNMFPSDVIKSKQLDFFATPAPMAATRFKEKKIYSLTMLRSTLNSEKIYLFLFVFSELSVLMVLMLRGIFSGFFD